MYGNRPDTYDWDAVAPEDPGDDVAPEDAGLFDDIGGEAGEGGQARTPGWLPSGLVEWFAVGQTLLPALLFIPGSQPYRLPIRTGAYAVSLLAFALWWFGRGGRQRGRHPATGRIVLTLLWLGL